ncbi:MAG: GGDEF domain-containing protein [Nitrospirota bacterium]
MTMIHGADGAARRRPNKWFVAVWRAICKWSVRPVADRGDVRETRAPRAAAGYTVDLAEALQVLRHAGYPEPPNHVRSENARIEYVLHALCELTIHDGLTGLVNARQFMTVLEQEVERSFRTGQPCSLLLIDLDHFKAINDHRGHVAGDQALRMVGRVMKSGTRTMDTAARYGGEEFAVLLPNTSRDSAAKIAERLRCHIAQEAVPVEGGAFHVTCSIGMACLSGQARRTGTEFIAMADEQLYRAKHQGRNQVCCDEEPALALTPNERLALSNRTRGTEGM